MVVLADYFPPAARPGGPARSIPAVIKAEMQQFSISVITRGRDLRSTRQFSDAETELADSEWPSVRVLRFSGLRQAWQICGALREATPTADMVYINSLFSPLYGIWPIIMLRAGLAQRTRVLLAPRGELSPGALAVKSFKKRLALPIIRRLTKKLDIVWHATSEHEAEDIRNFLHDTGCRTVIRTNPPPAPETYSVPINPQLSVAFVARMTPLKNFRLLVEAARQVNFPLCLNVVGILEDNRYWDGCVRELERLACHVRVNVLGHCDHDAVMQILRDSDAMVLPTRGENFGHAIAEALAVGCPVMIPDTTMWTGLIRDGCGWVISADDAAILARSLGALYGLSPTMRKCARERVSSLYAEWWRRTIEGDDSLFTQALSVV